jgi:homoserine dehydrogenase
MSGSRTVRVALAGCGAVGGELARALRAGQSALEREHAVRFEIARVLVRRPDRPRPMAFAAGVLTADLDCFLQTEADLVVEAIGGVEPAGTIAQAALERGRPFVTANKALIAERGDALARLARTHGTGLWFEAAVGGGVPVIRVLRDYLGRGPVRRIRGILNGTCNFVLTQLERGVSFAAAVAEAQRRGFAEADPSRDLDGRDAADKIAILAWLAFGVQPASLRLRRRGILTDGERLARGASAAGGRLRLVCECAADAAGASATVEPVVVAADSPFGRTVNEENRIAIDAGWPWPIELAGPGAGGVPTAAAVLADMIQATTTHARTAADLLPPVDTHFAPTQHGLHDAVRHAWLLGVRGGAAREARTALDGVGIGSVQIGATVGDAWIATSAASWPAVESLLHTLDSSGAQPTIARLEPVEQLVIEAEPVRFASLATVSAGG